MAMGVPANKAKISGRFWLNNYFMSSNLVSFLQTFLSQQDR